MTRSSRIEFLRVLSMLMIVYHHAFIYRYEQLLSPETIGYTISSILGAFGKIGVIIFVLISGYFAKPRALKLGKLAELNSIASFYMILGAILAIFLGERVNILATVIPTLTKSYWFLTTYAVLMLLQPLIMQGISLVKKEWLGGMTISAYLSSYVIYIYIYNTNLEVSLYPVYLMFLFVIWYVMGYLIRHHQDVFKKQAVWSWVKGVGVVTFLVISFHQSFLAAFPWLPSFFAVGADSLIASLFAISLFIYLVCSEIKLPYTKAVLSLAPLMFDVYLFHEQEVIRELIFGLPNDSGLGVIVFPLLVMAVAAVVAVLRQGLFRFLSRMVQGKDS